MLDGIAVGEHTERSLILALSEDQRRDIVRKTKNGLDAVCSRGRAGGRRSRFLTPEHVDHAVGGSEAIPFTGLQTIFRPDSERLVSDAYSPVPELNRLKEFDERCGREFYAHGFELREFGEVDGVETYSEEKEFVDSFLGFAKANRSGSNYSLWRVDDREDLATLPVVVFGDEGGIGVVARDLRHLFRQLGCDWWQTPSWDGAQFMEPDTDDRPSPCRGEYLAWLNENFGLAPPGDPNELRRAAEAKFGAQLESWVDRFYDKGEL